MKNLAFLEYIFMFDPNDTWSHLYEFENQLAKFFSSHNMEAQIIKTVEGGSTRRILLIKAKPLMPVGPSRPEEKKK